MTIIILLVQAEGIVSMLAGRSIFMISQGIVKKYFGSNADGKYQKKENSNLFLYGFRLSQKLIIEMLLLRPFLFTNVKVGIATLLQYIY
jgi:hypothetical protein